MTLLERLHIRHEALQDATETVEQVPESKEVAAHGRRVAEEAETGRAARGVRWLHWTAVLALLAGTAFVVTMLVTDGGTDEAIEWTTVQEGPGSNSLGPTTADGPEAQIEAADELSSYELVQRSIQEALAANQDALAEVIADLEANTQNELAQPITPTLAEVIADLEANTQNELAQPITPTLAEVIADLEANTQNER